MSRKLLLLIPALYAGTALRAQSIVSSSNPHRLKTGSAGFGIGITSNTGGFISS